MWLCFHLILYTLYILLYLFIPFLIVKYYSFSILFLSILLFFQQELFLFVSICSFQSHCMYWCYFSFCKAHWLAPVYELQVTCLQGSWIKGHSTQLFFFCLPDFIMSDYAMKAFSCLGWQAGNTAPVIPISDRMMFLSRHLPSSGRRVKECHS